jgi:NitT/TauT family transport system permease protein
VARKKNLETFAPWGLLIASILLWQLICAAFDVSEFVFPSPLQIVRSLIEFAVPIAEHAWRTFWTTMVGFAISIVVGVVLGFVIGSSRLAYAAMYPLMTAFNALPKAAFVPILVVWFGIGVGPAILTAFLISFFPIMVNIATGLATLEPELEDVLRVLGAKRLDVLIKVGLPRSMPYFFASLKVAVAAALIGTIVGELPTGAIEGLGARMLIGSQFGEPLIMWAALFATAILAGLLILAVGIVERLANRRMGVRA